MCYDCGKTGHFRRHCKIKGKKVGRAKDVAVSGIMIAVTGCAQSQPRIWVTVSVAQKKETSTRIQVVPDTGTQVCVARPELLATLGIEAVSLVYRGCLRNLPKVSLKPMGVFACRIQHDSCSATQEIFVMKAATKCYVSLQACKNLDLVLADFPHQTSCSIGCCRW